MPAQILAKHIYIERKDAQMAEFTHFNHSGEAVMVDVSSKKDTVLEAAAEGRITMSEECFQKIQNKEMGKGDVLGVARIAGIMGAKKTSELIPLCHILNLTKVVNIALLTIYDMCKAIDKTMEMGEIHLCRKSGGKSGDFIRQK